MPDRRLARLALGALALACTPTPPAGTATEATTADTTVDPSATESATSTGGPADTTDSTAEATSTTTSSSSGDATTDALGCGDGVAEPGEVCFERIVDDTYLTHLRFGDLDEDGHLDLVAVVEIPCPSITPGRPLRERPLPSPPGTPRDGGSSATLALALGDGAGGLTFVESPAFVVGAMNGPTLGDFDGDGHLDLVGGDYVWDGEPIFGVSLARGDGLGAFAEPVHTPTPLRVTGLAAGDLDGDADLDLVIAGPDGLLALQNDGAGAFAVGAPFADAAYSTPNLHDLDDDGHLDLVVLRDYPDPALEVYRGLGDSAFTFAATALAGLSLTDLAILAPADGTRPALLAITYESGQGYRLHAIRVQPGVALAPPDLLAEDIGTRVAIGNFDGGPRPDALLLSTGLGTLVGADAWPPAIHHLGEDDDYVQGVIAVGDLDEDGVDDVAYAASTLTLLLSNP